MSGMVAITPRILLRCGSKAAGDQTDSTLITDRRETQQIFREAGLLRVCFFGHRQLGLT